VKNLTSDIQTRLVDMMNDGVSNKTIAEACNYISLIEEKLELVSRALKYELPKLEIMTEEEMLEGDEIEIREGDVVKHIDGSWSRCEVVREIFTKNGEQYARFNGGGLWLLSRLTKDFS
jgi:hypothetical protein